MSMNIKEAKEQIKNAIVAYFSKDEFGHYVIPIERQRPVFLIGAPGIGKTAIMEQIAQELNVGLVSYSMTHHTRQSALGLPFIEKEEFDGVEYNRHKLLNESVVRCTCYAFVEFLFLIGSVLAAFYLFLYRLAVFTNDGDFLVCGS